MVFECFGRDLPGKERELAGGLEVCLQRSKDQNSDFGRGPVQQENFRRRCDQTA